MIAHPLPTYQFRRAALTAVLAMISLMVPAFAQEHSSRGSVSFMENRGQIVDDRGRPRPEIAFVAGARDARLFLRRDGISYVFAEYRSAPVDGGSAPAERLNAMRDDTVTYYRMDMDLVGASPDVEIVAEDTLAAYTNFYLAGCPAGITHVRHYRRLLYRNVYENIDMAIYGLGSGVKYDFIVHPGGRVADIRIRYRGNDSLLKTRDGGIRVTNPIGCVEEGAPYSIERRVSSQTLAPQGLQGSRRGDSERAVGTVYHVRDGIIGFDVGAYDAARTLVIDPTLTWSTFIGGGNVSGSAGNQSWAIAADGSGGIFIGGYSTSAAYPTTVGAYQRNLRGMADAFVTKFTTAGDTLWSTYYGGSLDEAGTCIAVDRGGNVVIAGYTASPADFPVLSATQPAFAGGTDDAFIVKLDGSGARQWATLYGGGGSDQIFGVAADTSGNIAFAGSTTSADFPTVAAFQGTRRGSTDVFIGKLTPAGAKVWSTYYGGTATQYARAATTDSSGNVLVAGSTTSTNFPIAGRAVQRTLHGIQDAFIVKLTGSGDTLWSTYLGGTNFDGASGIATDGNGNVFATGGTNSANFPVTSAAVQKTLTGANDLWAAKFDPIGDTLWASFIGGDLDEYGGGVAVDRNSNVLVTGSSHSVNFPVTFTAYSRTLAGARDVVVVKLGNATGDTLWSTYFGGNDIENGIGITADAASNIYITGNTASSANFPITNGAMQPARSHSANDGFVAKFGCQFVPSVARSGGISFCQGDSVILTAAPGTSYLWSNGATSRSITVKTTGRYAVTVTEGGGCGGTSDTIAVRVNSAAVPVITANNGTTICDGDSVRITTSAGYRRYLWSTSATDTLPTITVKRGGTYTVTVTDSNGCGAARDITITVHARPHPGITAHGNTTVCDGDSVALDADAGFNSYHWSTGAAGGSLSVGRTGKYWVTVTDAEGCTGTSDTIIVTVRKKPVVTITPSGSTTLCRGDSITLAAPPGMASYLWSTGAASGSIRVGESGAYTVTATDANGCTGTSGLVSIVVHDPPKPIIFPSDSVTLCAGDSLVLAAPVGYGVYLWSTNETTRGITVRAAGTYSVSVVDGNGCAGMAPPVIVRVLASPSAAITGPNSICPDRTVTYSVPATGGASYDWKVSGGTIVGGAGTNSITVHWGGVGAGSVQLSATLAANGCSREGSLAVSITNTLSPVVATSRVPILCDGDSVILTAPAGYSSYRWSTGDTAESITVHDSGSYIVAVADNGGCTGTSAPVRVTRNLPPKPVIGGGTPLQFCEGDSVAIAAPPGYASYLWSNGVRGRTVVLHRGGTYSITVTDSAGCIGSSDPIAVTMSPAPRPVVTGPSSICSDHDARFEVNGSPGATYTWSVSTGTIVSGQGTPSIVARWPANGADTVIVTQVDPATGCAGTDRYPITVDSVLRPAIDGPSSICEGDTIGLSAPSGYDSYLWSNGATTQSIAVWLPDIYSVEVAQSGGCRGRSEDFGVSTLPLPKPMITPGGTVVLCAGDRVMLDAGGGYASYRWSTGDSSQTITVRDAGRYSVTVTNAAGCTGASPEVTVELRAAPPMPAIAQLGDTLVASPALAYQWQIDGAPIAGAIAQRHVFTKLGSYTVVIRDSNGCAATSAPFMPEGGATASVILTAIEAAPGEHIFLPIVLAASRNLDQSGASNFSATLRFNGTLLVPAGATPVGSLKDGERSIPIAGVRPAGMSSGELMRLEFIAALGDAESTPVALDSFAWAGAPPVQSVITAGVFRLQGLCRSGNTRLVDATGSIALKASRPNPTGGPTTIEYETVEQGRTRIVVSDLLGRTVAVLLDEEIAPGRYVVSFDASRVPSGTYVYTLQTPTATLARIMVVGR